MGPNKLKTPCSTTGITLFYLLQYYYFTDINVGKVGTSINVLMQINHNTSILFHGGILMPSSENFRGILNSSNPSVAGEGDSRVIHTKT